MTASGFFEIMQKSSIYELSVSPSQVADSKYSVNSDDRRKAIVQSSARLNEIPHLVAHSAYLKDL
jgi:hypothetical protein